MRSWELGYPLMFWNRRAGPPGSPVFDLLTRSVISAISRIGSASVFMRFSSPARSRAAIHWRRSSKGKGALLGTDDYKQWSVVSGQWAVKIKSNIKPFTTGAEG